jgi:hypothetical protein
MEPGEALSSAAQIAVALAGFAGVVVAFRSSSLHQWSPLDKYRLWLLLSGALIPLFSCLLGMLLLPDRTGADFHLALVQRVFVSFHLYFRFFDPATPVEGRADTYQAGRGLPVFLLFHCRPGHSSCPVAGL